MPSAGSPRPRRARIRSPSQQRYDALMEHARDAIFVVAADTTIRDANRAAAKLHGVARSRIVGRSFLELLPPEERERVGQRFQAMLESGDVEDAWFVERAGGEPVPVEVSASRVEIDGELLTLAIVRDVSERRKAEAAFADSEAQYRRLVEEAPVGIYRSTRDGRFVGANPAFARLLGYDSVEEVLSLDIERDVYWDAAERERCLPRSGDPATASLELRLKTRQGTPLWVQVDARAICDASETPICFEGFVHGIEERKRAAELQRRSEEQYRLLFDASPLAKLVVDAQSRQVLAANAAAAAQYGYSREELLRLTLADLEAPGERWRESSAESGLHIRKDGTLLSVETLCHPLDFQGRPALLLRCDDSTRRIRLERRARVFSDLGRRLSAAQTMEDAASIISRCADELWRWDACAVDFYSADVDRIEPLLTVDVVDGRRRDVVPSRKGLEPTPRQRQILREGPVLVLRDSLPPQSDSVAFGDVRRLSASIAMAPIRHGRSVIGFISVQSYSPRAYDREDLDVLQSLADFCGGALARIRSAEQLSKSERLLREAQNVGRIASWEWDVGKGTVVWSKHLYLIAGIGIGQVPFTRSGALGLIDAADRPAVAAAVRRAIRNQEHFFLECRIRRPDGNLRTVQLRGEVLAGGDGRPHRVVGICQDVTDRRRFEDELRQSRERLRRLSARLIEAQEAERRHLARELHDEIGQALTAVKINLQAAQQGEEDSAARLADSMAIVEGTMAQVRDISLSLRPSILDDLGLVPALRWYAAGQAGRAGFELHFESDPAAIHVAPEIEIGCYRVVQEALHNVARHAGARNVDVRVRLEEGDLSLTVKDDGVGFDVAAAREQASANGNLGLLSMTERARLLGGRLRVQSAPGKGTSIQAALPLAPGP